MQMGVRLSGAQLPWQPRVQQLQCWVVTPPGLIRVQGLDPFPGWCTYLVCRGMLLCPCNRPGSECQAMQSLPRTTHASAVRRTASMVCVIMVRAAASAAGPANSLARPTWSGPANATASSLLVPALLKLMAAHAPAHRWGPRSIDRQAGPPRAGSSRADSSSLPVPVVWCLIAAASSGISSVIRQHSRQGGIGRAQDAAAARGATLTPRRRALQGGGGEGAAAHGGGHAPGHHRSPERLHAGACC